jgi:hypothetical protein
MVRNKPKNHAEVMARLTNVPAGAAGNSVEIDSQTQISIVLLMLGQKNNALLEARKKLRARLSRNPRSPTALTAAIQGIDAEVNLCLMVIQSIDANNPIQFPSPAEITALSTAVRQLGNATAQGAASAALIPAVADVIATFPR